MASRCSHCKAIRPAPVGGKAGLHQEAGKRNTCPGWDKPTRAIK